MSAPTTRPIDLTLHTLLTIDAAQFEATPLVGRGVLIRDLALSEAATSMQTMGQSLEGVLFSIDNYKVYAPSQAMAIWALKGYAVRVDVRIAVKTPVRAA